MRLFPLYFCFLITTLVLAQSPETVNVRIDFTHKAGSGFLLQNPQEFLSAEAILRRQRQNIPLDSTDLPVPTHFLDSIRAEGGKVWFTSRWFNSANVSLPDSQALDAIMQLSFVKSAERIALKKGKSGANSIDNTNIVTAPLLSTTDYGISFRQTEMLNGQLLHQKGYRGEGVTIAVIDAGFYRVDQLMAFSRVRNNGRLLSAFHLYLQNDDVFDAHTHGMHVLSIMAGDIDGKLHGTATDASYHLLLSEVDTFEFRIEEEAWIAAAEYADSAGAMIINSSLGYHAFDDSLMNYSIDDMDGKTARVSLGAGMAATKGMLVVSSAGNQGNSSWRRITAPADAFNILAVGAVDAFEKVVNFSSRGPAADGRVKPDISAMGSGTVVASPADGEVFTGTGTSLSAPVISGLSACLWQACPSLTAMEIRDVILKTSSRQEFPDNNVGYGLPDFYAAYKLCSEMEGRKLAGMELVRVFPNPFTENINVLLFTEEPQQVVLQLTDIAGRVLFSGEFSTGNMMINKFYINLRHSLSEGLYFISVAGKDELLATKLLKKTFQ